ncbi:MAG: hypothetical protein K0R38_7786, partial [Polyangiaceae bacterium]|nr:hypothetical protein [Polyangiaceae bacterium]
LRSSRPAPATRPDVPAALGRAPESEPTTLRPALESATTVAALTVAARSGGTLRIEPVTKETSPSFYGPDTLVESLTSAPTGVPAPSTERTEFLLTQPLVPGGRDPTDPGPTRTAVPLVEPNLTPPPVVPASASVPPDRIAGPRRAWPLFVVAGVTVGLLGGAAWLWRSRPSAGPSPRAAQSELVAPQGVQAATPPRTAGSAPSVRPVPEAVAGRGAEGQSQTIEPPPLATSVARPPAATTTSARNDSRKGAFLSAVAVPTLARPAPSVTPSSKSAAAPRPSSGKSNAAATPPAGMPGSGL